MAKVKLLSNLQTGDTLLHEGSVVALADDQSSKLLELGAAELTDEPEKVVKPDTPVAPSQPSEATNETAPLASPQDGPQSPATPTSQPTESDTQASSSPNLHLG